MNTEAGLYAAGSSGDAVAAPLARWPSRAPSADWLHNQPTGKAPHTRTHTQWDGKTHTDRETELHT